MINRGQTEGSSQYAVTANIHGLRCALRNVWPSTQINYRTRERGKKKRFTQHFLIDFMRGQPGDYIRVRCRGRRAEMNVVVQLVLVNGIVFDIL